MTNDNKLRKIAEMALRGTIHEQKVARKILLKHGISDPNLYLHPPTPTPETDQKTLEETIDKFVAEMEAMATDALEGALSRIADRFRSILR
jgi:hypothetical protein